jgi:hypothetical protein
VPRRTHPLLFVAALATGLLLALGVAACGGEGSQSAETLEAPPLTVGTGAALPSTSSARTTRTTSTTSTTDDDASVDTGGASDPETPDTGGAVDPDTGDTGTADPDAGDTGGGAPSTGGGDTGTPSEPSNPGGAAPDYDDFCAENPGAC